MSAASTSFEQLRKREEFANALTHGIGAIAALVAGGALVTFAARSGNVWQVVGIVVFGLSLVLLYTASALYHAARRPATRLRLKVLDHCAIYVLIAGSYTPFMLGSLRGGWGWSLFGVIWGLAVAGVAFKLFLIGRFPRASTMLYLAMGWLVVIAAGPMIRALSVPTLLWLAAGGLAYTAGTAFYHNSRIPYAHTIWHLFVLAGSACHFAAVALQVSG